MWCAPSVKIRTKGTSISTPFCARHYAGVQIESSWAKSAAKGLGPCWILSTQGTPALWQRFMPALRYKRRGVSPKRSHQQSNLHDIAAEIGECVSYVVQCGRFAEGRKISGLIRLKGYNRVTQFQEHEVIFDLAQKCKHTPIYPQLFAPPESSEELPFLR